MQVAGVMRIMEASFRTTITRNELAILHFSILIISLSVLMFEIALTRIFSVMLSYHYVFIAVSVALFGLGIGAIFFRAIRLRMPLAEKSFDILSVLSLIFAFSVPFSIMLSLKIPSTQHLIAYYAVTFVPFFFAGMIFALAFDRFTERSSKLYSASLAGSGIGCFAVIFALESFGGVNTTMFIGSILAIVAILLALSTRKKRLVALSLIGFLLVSTLFVTNLTHNYVGDISSDNPEKELFLFLNDPELDAKITRTYWSAYGRTDLVELGIMELWNAPGIKVIFTDGGAGTNMFQFDGDNFDNVEHLKYTSAFFPFYFGDKDSVLIIGPGGGMDVLIALMGGAKDITAVEVNPDIVNIVREESEYNGGIYYHENVRWIIDEGRNFIKRSTEKYDVIMLTLVYTKSAREVGYSLVESYIFTVEAFDDYLNHLKDNGRLVIVVHDEVGVQRLFVTALTTLNRRGKTTQEGIGHVASVQGGVYYPFPVFILKKAQFSENGSIEMYTKAREIGLQPMFMPNVHMSQQLAGLAMGQITLHELIYGTSYDISPTTDDSPFFYNYDEKGLPSSLSSLLYSILFLTSLVMIGAWVSLKHRGTGNTDSSKTIPSTKISSSNFIFYFSFLGLGFMLIEVALVQKFILFLGQPTLTLSVLLFSLLVGGGVGSLFSDRFKEDMVRKVAFICFLIGILTISYAVMLPSIFDRFLGHDVVARSLISAVLLFPLGFLMGMPFPTGLKIFKRAFEADVAWMWGINGAMSVMGSVLAVAIAILLGFSWALALGAFAYFCISAILLH